MRWFCAGIDSKYLTRAVAFISLISFGMALNNNDTLDKNDISSRVPIFDRPLVGDPADFQGELKFPLSYQLFVGKTSLPKREVDPQTVAMNVNDCVELTDRNTVHDVGLVAKRDLEPFTVIEVMQVDKISKAKFEENQGNNQPYYLNIWEGGLNATGKGLGQKVHFKMHEESNYLKDLLQPVIQVRH